MVSNYELIKVGEQATPIIIIDNFIPNPLSLVETIAQHHPFTKRDGDFYPGVRSHPPQKYVEHLHTSLPQLFSQLATHNGLQNFGVEKPLHIPLVQLSIANQAPKSLSPIQCIPHIDTQKDNEWALVHYLFSEPLGGTAFYRHIETGLERVNAAQYAGYFKTLKRQATSVGLPPKAYINGDTAMFTQIARIEPMFNRAVLYPANLLHSGCLPNDISDYADVKEGRLTANASIIFKD
ncbi:hypothetical protein AMBLS11_17860 [Alteromonas macleodii str. 'Black Sea 11']|nr:hypothetical protein AMBLS11_17860 [Alteromonas macleodii str. 'Black Sea 11']NKW89960.1 hypothetical protein [Alteromonadaceae bacterium A_SAG4]NKX05671.1 hypothetical protein [Alteromonadaceae bacterium A_SAG6]NKX35771.1 hypothetical protein [Alteromonadaceae bacterium A_SAG3]NKX68678.1 hypothetical protein [Alteromonadaceae bacterium A_SAG7]